MTRRHPPRWRAYMRFWGPDPAAETEDEFEFHVRERTDELVEQGLDPESAREHALRGFGDMERVKATCIDLAAQREGRVKRRELLAVLRQDVVFAVRQMKAQSLLTVAALLTIAVGIGATTSIFSVVNAVLLRPLPHADGERIVAIWETYRDFERGRASAGHLRDWTEQARTLEATGALLPSSFNLTTGGDPERVAGAQVTAGYFDVLYMPPVLGRYIEASEERAGVRVVVLSHELWQRRFGGDRGIIGRTIELNAEAHTVVGVTPAGYRLSDADEQLWTPLSLSPEEQGRYGSRYLLVFGKLRPGSTLEAARADLARVTETIRERVPAAMTDRGVNVERYADTLIGEYRTQLLVLLGAVLFVLLLACGNVASLLLARATTRHKELAIRAALGGGRSRLIRQLLTESVVLAGLGGVLGVALAAVGVRALVAAAPPGVPRLGEAGLQLDVLLFAVGATLACGLLFGLAPALRATRVDLQSVLREGGRSSRGGSSRDRLRSVLVAGEMAVALMLLVGAGLFIRSALNVQRVPVGFQPDGVTLARVTLPADQYESAGRVTTTYGLLLEELRAQPGVAGAGLTTGAPLLGLSPDILLTLRDFPREPSQMQMAYPRLVSDGYFETLRIPLRQGRHLEPADLRAGASPVVVINETLARQAFADADPIGQYISGWETADGSALWKQVVGVVGDARSFGREAETPPEMFLPFTHAPAWWWGFDRTVVLVSRAAGGATTSAALRTAVRSIDPTLPLYDVQSMTHLLANSVASRRFNMLLLTLLGITGLVLAAVGIYGVVGFFVLQRTHEFGLRMALGATTADVLRLVMAHAGRVTAAGVVIGGAGAYAATRVLRSMLFEVDARDPVTFVLGALVLLLVAALAALLPARRATRVAPTRSLSGS